MILTPWSYKLTGDEPLPDFLTEAQFNCFTNDRYLGDSRIKANIPSATKAIRDYCGWHIWPNLECEATFRIEELRDAFTGPDVLVQLPARFVTSIKSVLLNAKFEDGAWTGDETTDYELEQDSILRIFDVGCHDRRSKIRIVYDAGITDDQLAVLRELTAHRVTHAVASSYGITSEAAGGVSVTYNAGWAGNTRSTALPDDNKDVLEPYRVRGVY